MDNLKEWLLSVCSFTIASTLLHLLLPRDRISDTVKTVIRLVLLMLIFMPLCGFDFSSDMFEEFMYKYEQDEPEQQPEIDNALLLRETEAAVCMQAEVILSSYYSGKYKIDIDADILSDRCIHIKQIRIILSSEIQNLSDLQSAMESFFPTCKTVIEQEVKEDAE